jgi:hypothetical protein
MTETNRALTKSRIASAQARDENRRQSSLAERVEDRALEAKDKFVEFAKEHPVGTVAGGLVIGVLIASMFKGPRRAAAKGGARAAGLAAIAQDAGRGGARKLDGLGDTWGDTARDLRHGAADRLGDARDVAQSATRHAGRSLSRMLGRR